MFARAATRSLKAAPAPLRMAPTVRHNSNLSPPFGNPSSLIAAAGALALGAGSYYWFTSLSKEAEAKKAGETGDKVVHKEAKAAFTGGDQGFVPLTVKDVETLNHNTKLVRLALPAKDEVSGMKTASALLTKFKPEGAEKPVVRPYTPVSDDDARGHMDLLVKRYEGGAMSTHIHSLKPGDKLEVKGPIVKYAWTPNKHDHIALVAGGTGITPMYQLIKAVLQNPGVDKTRVTLVFGNIAEEDILLHKELRHFENMFPQQFRAFYVLEKPTSDWEGSTGYITKDLLKQVLPEPTADTNFKVFVCGPPPMMKALSGPKKSPSDQGELSGVLQELGYTKEQVLKF